MQRVHSKKNLPPNKKQVRNAVQQKGTGHGQILNTFCNVKSIHSLLPKNNGFPKGVKLTAYTLLGHTLFS